MGLSEEIEAELKSTQQDTIKLIAAILGLAIALVGFLLASRKKKQQED